MQFQAYDDTTDVANIVVDGSPNAATVLTLTHWPGIAQPPDMAADLSAQMVFNYLDRPFEHPRADVVTNNHFDQDGLVGIYALINPDLALRHRDVLIDVAAGGDFATYRHRAAARASMTIWAYAQRDVSPLGDQLDAPYPEACAALYENVLPQLLSMVLTPERFGDLWRDEDAQLTASENAITDGLVAIDEIESLDLALVTIDTDSLAGGHRFAAATADFIHPMAINNATDCCRLLLMRGHDYLFLDRYETWVQYQSRQLPARVDLAPLAERLTGLETRAATWTASQPSSLTPELRPDRASSISVVALQEAVTDHLRTAPAAWNPFE